MVTITMHRVRAVCRGFDDDKCNIIYYYILLLYARHIVYPAPLERLSCARHHIAVILLKILFRAVHLEDEGR